MVGASSDQHLAETAYGSASPVTFVPQSGGNETMRWRGR